MGLASAQSTGHTFIYAALQTQESTLLSIPAEVRNQIYDAVLENPTTVAICYRNKRRMSPVEHPLTRACRQLREEFLDAWTEHATDNASTVVCAIRDFETGDTGRVREMLASLPPLEDGSQRTFVMKFFITNHFEKSARQKHRQQYRISEDASQVKFITDVAFDYKTLDAGYIESVMRNPELVPSNALDAFWETKQRYKIQH